MTFQEAGPELGEQGLAHDRDRLDLAGDDVVRVVDGVDRLEVRIGQFVCFRS
jgi:hypothetical protein